MANRVTISSILTDRSKPSIQLLVTFTAIRMTEIITGKLRIAIKMLLLFAFAAMPESKVREAENPNDVKTMRRVNKPMSWIGFFKNKVKRATPESDISKQRTKL